MFPANLVRFSTVSPITKVSKARHDIAAAREGCISILVPKLPCITFLLFSLENLLALIQPLVDESRYDSQLGEPSGKMLEPLRAGDQVQKQDSLLGNTARLENIDSHDSGTAYQEFKHGGLEQTLLVFGLR